MVPAIDRRRQKIPQIVDKSQILHSPGVYIYKDAKGQVLYVGKAINLYHRVSSYFVSHNNEKTALLVKNIAKIETIIVESELEALILEANLIKKFLPPFNIRLTDDKDYLYIAVTKEVFPKIITARKKELTAAQKYWGPFPSSRTVKAALKALRKVFPWCTVSGQSQLANKRPCFLNNGVTLEPTSSRGYEVIAKTRFRPCFYYHLNLCPGSCAGLISSKDYQKIINRFAKFMDGKKDELVKDLTADMTKAARQHKFEEANRFKKTLAGIAYLIQPNRTKLYLENPNFLQEETQLALRKLQQDLQLNKLPERIEGYDISNVQGKEAVGSLAVLTNGEIDKSQYRKFKIRISGKPNDAGMMGEIIKRRLNHPEWPKPDLIIVDGGKAQARAAKAEIVSGKSDIPLFGLAKRMEWLYPPEGEIIKLASHSLSLKLLKKLRDEAHWFALSYHRKLHRRSILNNIK